MAKITFTLTYDKVRKVLSRLTGRRQENILGRHSLVDDYGFNDAGFTRLHGALIDEFRLYKLAMTKKDVSDSETVNDLTLAVWSKLPGSVKEQTAFTDGLLATTGLIDAFMEEVSKTSQAKREERMYKTAKDNE